MEGDDGSAVVRERVKSQVFTHWNEMATFIATADIGAAALAAGAIVTSTHSTSFKALLVAMLAASSFAFALAYYSIQVGTVGLIGPTALFDVFGAFTIAGAQFALPLWVAHLARLNPDVEGSARLAELASHWIGLAALFGFSGSLANAAGARRRTKRHPVATPAGYDAQQQSDRRSAFISGLVLLGGWLVAQASAGTAAQRIVWAGTVLAAISFLGGLWSQRRTARLLEAAIR